MLEVFERYNELQRKKDKTRGLNRGRFSRRGKVVEDA